MSAILFLTFLFFYVFSTSFVGAVAPIFRNVKVSEEGGHTILILDLTHHGVMPTDRVTAVAVRLDGGEPVVYDIDPDQGQGDFSVEIDLGALEGNPKAELSVYCAQQGWTRWSEPFEVPEFQLVPVILLLVALTLAVALIRKGSNLSNR